MLQVRSQASRRIAHFWALYNRREKKEGLLTVLGTGVIVKGILSDRAESHAFRSRKLEGVRKKKRRYPMNIPVHGLSEFIILTQI